LTLDLNLALQLSRKEKLLDDLMEGIAKQLKKRRRQHLRLKIQSFVIDAANRLAIYTLVILLCIAAHVFYLPQINKLAEKEKALAEARLVEENSRQAKDRAMRENRALQEDPAYMELVARDILDYYKPGEIIFEVDRSQRENLNEKAKKR
jgi:cell division protein FtsB